jgi:hypothetical protein
MKRNIRRQSLSVALFPFLAVLICTMGVVIVLLVLFTHQARVEAKTIVARDQALQATAAADDKQREQFEDAQWRRELLEQQRTEKAAELAQSRARLAHLEEHLQKLQRRAAELIARAGEIDQGKQIDDGQLAAGKADLARLQSEISRKQIELDQARRQQQESEQWYALIPYEGPQGTRRRPIYLECTQRGIVLQPEGIVFRPEDFNGPLGPGNPLDAALRTVREYLQQAHGNLAGNPYPLLVVRPSGVVAYGAARAALKSWDDEFGYELISDEKQLVFGDPDPALAAGLQRSVAQARQRQLALAAAMPRKFGDDPPLTSFDPASVPSIGGVTSNSGGRGVGSGRGGFGGFDSGASASGPALGSPAGGPGGNVPNPGATAGSPGAGGETGYPTTGYGDGQAGPYGTAGAAGQAATAGQPGAGQSGGSGKPGPDGQFAAGGSAQNGSQTGSGGASVNLSRRGPSQVKSGASRGSNWGLPGASGRATGITRPMRIAMLLDRIVIIPEAGDDRPQQNLPVPDRLRQSDVEAVVAGVQKEMKSWGLAVAGGYWIPRLDVQVAPDAEHHFADLQIALQNSGFELNRKE